jgi:hypothetical protein
MPVRGVHIDLGAEGNVVPAHAVADAHRKAGKIAEEIAVIACFRLASASSLLHDRSR